MNLSLSSTTSSSTLSSLSSSLSSSSASSKLWFSGIVRGRSDRSSSVKMVNNSTASTSDTSGPVVRKNQFLGVLLKYGPNPIQMCSLEKRGSLFIITLTGDGQHRLNPTLIASLLSTLSQIRSQATPGSVLITTAHGRFFSNGFDLAWAQSAGSPSAALDRLHHMVDSFKRVVAAFISLPMPTIAALSGHAAGAGFMLAISHDYILMKSDKGVLYMPEVDLGMTLPDYFVAGFRSKILSSAVMREIVLRGMKVKATEALKMGIVSSAHDSTESLMEATVRLGEELAKRKSNCDVYGEIRKSLYPEMSEVLGLTHRPIVSKI